MSDFVWATVTSASPLRVQLDGDSTPLPITPDSIAGPLGIGDRVRAELYANRIVLHGRSGGAVGARSNAIINGSFRTNQRGYASGSNIAPGAYCFDRWRGSGVTNLFPNPSIETSTSGFAGNTGAPTLTSDIAQAKYGTHSLKAVSTTTQPDCAVQYAINVVAGKTYTLSWWVYSVDARTTVNCDTNGQGTMLAGQYSTGTAIAIAAGVWTRLYITFVAASTGSVIVYFHSAGGPAVVGKVVYYDGFMLTEGSSLYSYFDGSMTDCSWSGVSNASNSASAPNFGTVFNLVNNPQGNYAASGIQRWTTDSSATGGITTAAATVPGQPAINHCVRSSPGAGSTGGIWYNGGTGATATPVQAGCPAIVGGQTYTVSTWVKTVNAKSLSLRVQELNNAGGTTATVSVSSTITTTAGVWSRLDVTFTANAATTWIYFYVYLNSGTWSGPGDSIDAIAMAALGNPQALFFDGSTAAAAPYTYAWTSTVNDSISTQSFAQSLTFTADSNFGQTVTLSASGRVAQIVERANVPAGAYNVTHSGTAQMRVYNNTLAPGSRPAFQAAPFAFTADGTDDVVVEFSGGGSGATISNVRMYAGLSDFGFALSKIDDELRACQRYYVRWSAANEPSALNGHSWFGAGTQVSTTQALGTITLPVPLRTNRPALGYSGVQITDMLSYNTPITLLTPPGGTYTANQNTLSWNVGMAAVGAANRYVAFVLLGGSGSWLDVDAELR